MGKYCCFNCPESGHDNTRELDHICPTCGEKYGFPKFDAPLKIGNYNIEQYINRGFYGAVYLVKDRVLNKPYVLKVIPKSIYKFHKKDFYKECQDHAELASESQYIVDISSATEERVEFSNKKVIDCYVAVLKYVKGVTLREILISEDFTNSISIAQIAIDLFKILDDLRKKKKNHNDLHPENLIIQQLSSADRRSGEIDNFIRVVAIDIGSLTSENKAGDSPDRIGDMHWVANYLISLSEKLIKNPDKASDQNYRLASLFQDRAKLLYPASEFQRTPNFDEIIESIKNCFNQQAFPWENPLKLLNFNDTYNAQTLEPWFVPSLLVDPDDQWLTRISGKGPLVITGMRGCGKTMMLRAVQFHARVSAAKLVEKQNVENQIELLKNEGFVGLYVSCKELLDKMGKAAEEPIHQPYSRLFIWYGIESIKALRHLKSISEKTVKFDFHIDLVNLYKEHLFTYDLLADVKSEMQLEQRLLDMIFSLNKGEDKYIIQANPANAFPALAQTIRNCSSIWTQHYILFLLDDVSTRYLSENNIQNLLSSLIFQSKECAFKITSEVQTIELVLFSPGKIEKAKKGRDFETFDLGGAVNQKIRNKGGKQFVADILNRRANSNPKHPTKHPIELIGDSSLKSIAENIVMRGRDKNLRKRIYHGLSALSGVCVGDIGDIINLYDMIIGHYDHEKQICPIPAERQSECFQDLCSVRLHEVNLRGSEYKSFALSFAQASYELLMKSYKDGDARLRQYYSIYIRITTGNTQKQYEKIRQLLDAGIFVYSKDPLTPRTLGIDTNPINQFKLTFRKLYGISNLIGLTQGDRFELSGEKLENWLNKPEEGKEILIKSVGGTSSNIDEGDDIENDFIDSQDEYDKNSIDKIEIQGKLAFDYNLKKEDQRYTKREVINLINEKTPKIKEIDFKDLENETLDLLICALGFEERTFESVKSILKLKPAKILLVRYKEIGKSSEIIEAVKSTKIPFEIIEYETVKTSFDIPSGKILCDITGMSKSLIFNIIRNTLKINGQVWFSHTQAEIYYPLNDEIKSALEDCKSEDNFSKLDLITKNVIKGEKGPHEVYDLLFSDSDESKKNLLVSFSSPKYEKLFKILENRSFDKIQIISPEGDSARSYLSNLASEVISKSYSNTELFQFDTNELKGILNFLTTQYQKYYIDQNFNFEFALTGSKKNTVACAAISATFKISHCWYITPNELDTNQFSKGVGSKTYFHISINL